MAGFQEAIARSTTSISEQGHLVKKLRFPVELLVASSAAAALVLQLAGLAVFGGFVLVSGRGAVQPLVFVAALAFEIVLLAGPCLLLAALNVFFRDLTQLVSPLLMIVLYLSPILYPSSLIPAPFTPFLAFNPVADLVALFRASLFGGPLPPAARLLGWTLAFLLLASLPPALPPESAGLRRLALESDYFIPRGRRPSGSVRREGVSSEPPRPSFLSVPLRRSHGGLLADTRPEAAGRRGAEADPDAAGPGEDHADRGSRRREAPDGRTGVRRRGGRGKLQADDDHRRPGDRKAPEEDPEGPDAHRSERAALQHHRPRPEGNRAGQS